MPRPTSIKSLLSPAFIEAHAIPSNRAYGQAICDRGAVEIIESTDERVEAWVGGLDGAVIEGGGSRRRVVLTTSDGELQWRCTGNPKDHQIFCKHCVALALALLKT